jgi:hypothetical protein
MTGKETEDAEVAMAKEEEEEEDKEEEEEGEAEEEEGSMSGASPPEGAKKAKNGSSIASQSTNPARSAADA